MTGLYCLAMLVYFEARGEPDIGKYAVAEVVMNRVESEEYPDTICDVVFEDRGPKARDCQFSFTCDGKEEVVDEPEAFDKAMVIAKHVLAGHHEVTDGAVYFLQKDYKPKWIRNVSMTAQYGNHIFYR